MLGKKDLNEDQFIQYKYTGKSYHNYSEYACAYLNTKIMRIINDIQIYINIIILILIIIYLIMNNYN